MQLQLLSAGGKLIVNLFGGEWVVLTGTLWVESTEERPSTPPARPCSVSEHQAGHKCTTREDGGRGATTRMWLYSAMGVRLKKKKKRMTMPIPSPPNLDLTRLKCWLLKPATRLVHRRRHRRHGQLFRETLMDALQYTYTHTHVCKQNVQGTNAWLWYMCNRVVLLYSYIMNFFSLHSILEKEKKRKEIWLLSKRVLIIYLFFFKLFFMPTVLKYV